MLRHAVVGERGSGVEEAVEVVQLLSKQYFLKPIPIRELSGQTVR
jgi:hypothetical protein